MGNDGRTSVSALILALLLLLFGALSIRWIVRAQYIEELRRQGISIVTCGRAEWIQHYDSTRPAEVVVGGRLRDGGYGETGFYS